MKYNVKLVLIPDVCQFNVLLDTILIYNKMCNYISRIVHKQDCLKRENIHYWKVDNNINFYDAVCAEFPDINTSFILLAFRKIEKVYKGKRPNEAYIFSEILDCTNHTMSIKFVLPSPNNIGMLTISTLAGCQIMHFVFDDSQRLQIKKAFEHYDKIHNFQLVYRDHQFILTTDVYDIKESSVIYENPISRSRKVFDIIEKLDVKDTELRHRHEIEYMCPMASSAIEMQQDNKCKKYKVTG